MENKNEKTILIELKKLDDFLEDYNYFKHEGESFCDFIRGSKETSENDKDKPDKFDWVEVEEENIIEVYDDE